MNKHAIIATIKTAANGNAFTLESARFGVCYANNKPDVLRCKWNHEISGLRVQAVAMLESMGYTIYCASEISQRADVIMVNEFISLADAKAGKRWNDGVVA